MADSQTQLVIGEVCSIYDVKFGCFGPPVQLDDGTIELADPTPFWAAIWYGIQFIVQAFAPLILYNAFKDDAFENITRNNATIWAWHVLRWGGLALYTPLAVLFPMTYFSQGFIDIYMKIYKFLSGPMSAYHLVTAGMLWYAQRIYLYETAISDPEVTLDFYLYFLVVYVLFWMTSQPMELDFHQFYNMKVITLLDIHPRDQ